MTTQEATTLHQRVQAVAETLLPESKISAAFLPIIRSQLKSFLGKVTEEELRGGLVEVRDKIIPFLLGENEDTHPK